MFAVCCLYSYGESILLSSPHLGDETILVKSRRSGEQGRRSETREKRYGLQLIDVQLGDDVLLSRRTICVYRLIGLKV